MWGRGLNGVRFTPGEFKYNGRIAAAILPSLLVLAGFGGRIPSSIGLVGTMVAYILDATRFREGALGAIWLTMGIANLSLFFSEAGVLGDRPIAMSLMISTCSGTTLFTTGIWATLQFKWIQIRYPVVVLAFEKLLLATAFTTAATVQTLGLIAAVGVAHACFYLLAVLCLLYHMLALPLNTSFHVQGKTESAIGGKVDEDLRIQAPLEAGVAALLLTLLPGSLYTIVHLSVLSESKHLWSVLLLISVPALYLSVLKEGLWWVPCTDSSRMAIRQVLCLGSLGVSLAALEGRLIFPVFGQYILLHPPWNYLLVTLALYGFAAITIVYFSGVLSSVQATNLGGTVLLVSALLGSFAAGLPIPVIPAPLFAAGGLALFLQSKDIKDYMIFYAGALCTAAWFLHHHFYFLDIDFQGTPLWLLCIILLELMMFAILLPAFYIMDAPPGVATWTNIWLCHATQLTVLEEQLYIGVDEVEGEIYPAGMVLLTSFLGILALRRLLHRGKIGVPSFWILSSLLAGKLSMLLLPQARLAAPLTFLLLAVTSPLQFGSRQAGKPAVQPWQPVACILAVTVAVLAARNAIYDLLHFWLGQRPTEGLLMGVLVLTFGAGLVPLVMTVYKGRRDPKRVVGLILACGMLLSVLTPPLPYAGGAKCPSWLPDFLCRLFRFWDIDHQPNDGDDISIWGEYGDRSRDWFSWILVVAALSMLSSATQDPSKIRKPFRSISLLAFCGLSLGVYLALEFFPGQLILQVLVTIGIGSLAAFLFGLRLRGVASSHLLALLLSCWAITFPLGLAVQWALPLPPLPQRAARLFPDSAILVEEQRRNSNRAALLAVYCAEALLVAFATKLRISVAQSPVEDDLLLERNSSAAQLFRVGNMYADSAARFLGQCLPDTNGLQAFSAPSRPKGVGARNLENEGLGWLPSAANVITIASFAMGMILSKTLEQDSDTAIFLLSPMLLLLNQDRRLHWLDSKARYLPPTLVISAYLTISAMSQVLPLLSSPRYTLVGHKGYTVTFLKNLWLLGFALPGHFTLNKFLWSGEQITGAATILIACLDAIAIAFTNLTIIRLLAASGFVMSLTQWIALWRMRTEAFQVI